MRSRFVLQFERVFNIVKNINLETKKLFFLILYRPKFLVWGIEKSCRNQLFFVLLTA